MKQRNRGTALAKTGTGKKRIKHRKKADKAYKLGRFPQGVIFKQNLEVCARVSFPWAGDSFAYWKMEDLGEERPIIEMKDPKKKRFHHTDEGSPKRSIHVLFIVGPG